MGFFAELIRRFLALGFQLAGALVAGIFGAPAVVAERVVGEVSVRSATPAEVIDVRHAVLRAGRPRETAVFEGDDGAQHWVAENGELAVGVVSVMPAAWPGEAVEPVPTQQLRGMAVLEAWRGRGVGAEMLKAVHAEVGVGLWCNARQSAVAFYKKHGWRTVGESFVIEPIGSHTRMVYQP